MKGRYLFSVASLTIRAAAWVKSSRVVFFLHGVLRAIMAAKGNTRFLGISDFFG